jgi:SAM-dependent methyltransferase
VPGLITSDLLQCDGVDLVLDAGQLPFGEGTLRGIAMTNVLHHVPDVRAFFRDAARCIRPGGAIAMIEPWVTPWSRVVWGRLHHEPFVPEAADWTFPSTGPLSGANGALPWILFERDRARFLREFPAWRVHSVEPRMPFRYLLSGGVSMRPLLPGLAEPVCRRIEQALSPWAHRLAMFARIVLIRNVSPS